MKDNYIRCLQIHENGTTLTRLGNASWIFIVMLVTTFLYMLSKENNMGTSWLKLKDQFPVIHNQVSSLMIQPNMSCGCVFQYKQRAHYERNPACANIPANSARLYVAVNSPLITP